MLGMIIGATVTIIILYLLLANSQNLSSVMNGLTAQYVHAINVLQGRGS